MMAEQTVLLSLLRAAMSGEKVILPENIDWKSVIKEAKQQTVSLMAFDAAEAVKNYIPPEIYEHNFKRLFAMLSSNARVGYAQSELIEILNREDIPYYILKGESAAEYYPRPELRALGDVDFLIDPSQRETVEQLLINNGYQRSHEGHICHIVFQKPGANLEMHFEIPGIPHGTLGNRVREFMKDAVYSYRIADIGTGEFHAPNAPHHGLILLLHMQHHMLGEGLGLRHLCDWACFVSKTSGQPFWTEVLIPLLDEIGMRTYASVMTKTCSMYLGTPCPEWVSDVDEVTCEEIMEDILSGGNFGRKDEQRMSSGMLISNRGKDGTNHGKIYNLFQILKASTKELYPIVDRYPFFYPIVFIYRIFRYAIMVIKGDRVAVYKTIPQANKRKSIYEKLHIFEVEK